MTRTNSLKTTGGISPQPPIHLNNRIPGLPEWPSLAHFPHSGEYVVCGRHLSHDGFRAAKKRLNFFAWCLLLLGCATGYLTQHFGLTALALGPFAFYTLLIICAPIPRWLARASFQEDTLVRFSRESLVINNTPFTCPDGLSIQFRAQRPHVDEERYKRLLQLFQQGKLSETAVYELKFIRVEMIYGSRLVTITSIESHDRADQFALVLQVAYELAKQQQGASARSGLPGRRLPE